LLSPTLEQFITQSGLEPATYADYLAITIEYVNAYSVSAGGIHKTENEFKYGEIRKARGQRRIIPVDQRKPPPEPMARFWSDVVRICDVLAYDGSMKTNSRRKGVAFVHDPKAIAYKLQNEMEWYWAAPDKVRAAQEVKKGQIPNGSKERPDA
jgi:hypothetical protein